MHPDLAHVVQRAGEQNAVLTGFVEPELLSQELGEQRNAHDVLAGDRIAKLRGARQSQKGLSARGLEFPRPQSDLGLDALVGGLQQSLPVRELGDQAVALDAGEHEHEVLEQHPARMLQEPPLGPRSHAVHRNREVQAAHVVVHHHDDRSGHQDAPIQIERKKRQRDEDVEVGFDAPTGDVDEQASHQHLATRHDVAGRSVPGELADGHPHRRADQKAQQHGGLDMGMEFRLGTRVAQRAQQQSRDDRADHLDQHHPAEQAIHPRPHREQALLAQAQGAGGQPSRSPVAERNEQPNVGADEAMAP